RIVLDEHIQRRSRPQRLDDLLERPATFLEVGDLATGKPRLLAKEALLWLRTQLEWDLAEEDLFSTNRRIAARLVDGTSIAGNVLYDTGTSDDSLCEFMNRQGHYFEVVQDSHIYFVHKKFVCWVSEEMSE
ncbi:MAG: hypothetical protein V2A73_08270, partial [Pseudomonadota bacterium]